jgi:hypothetical protein
MNERDLLKQHVLNLNEKSQAWMDAAPEGEQRMRAIYDDTDIDNRMNDYGVRTPADWDAVTAWEGEDYCVVFKAHNNAPVRSLWVDAEWESEIELLAIKKQ